MRNQMCSTVSHRMTPNRPRAAIGRLDGVALKTTSERLAGEGDSLQQIAAITNRTDLTEVGTDLASLSRNGVTSKTRGLGAERDRGPDQRSPRSVQLRSLLAALESLRDWGSANAPMLRPTGETLPESFGRRRAKD